jgi:aminoglycoside phosphotransferase (APT) family kinase protein
VARAVPGPAQSSPVTTGDAAPRLHDDQVDLSVDVVSRLVAEQFPEWAGLPVRALPSAGTVHGVYRLGDDLCARLPLTPRFVDDLAAERTVLDEVAPRLPLAVPRPVADGVPGFGYPFRWAIYRWIPGDVYSDRAVRDEAEAAVALAEFVHALRRVPVTDLTPRAGRRPLADLDEATRRAIVEAGDDVDGPACRAAWRRALAAPAWDGVRIRIHADLLRPNLLLRTGRLHAVLDFGAAGAGDPATDVIAAWAVFGPVGRRAYRDALRVDPADWARARGIALHQALLGIPYYRRSHPTFAALMRRTVGQVLSDQDD